jgi:hypothetical protein
MIHLGCLLHQKNLFGGIISVRMKSSYQQSTANAGGNILARASRYLAFPTLSASKASKVALIAFATYAISNVPVASAGLFSGLVTLGGCVGAGILFPANLFWAAAPCYELTMLATANPLLP